MPKPPHKLSRNGMTKMRRCHDCGRPTWNFRCDACWRKLRGGDMDLPEELELTRMDAILAAELEELKDA